MMAASNASLEALDSVLLAGEPARVAGGAAGSDCNLQVAPTSTIIDRLQALDTPTLEVSVSAPQVSLLFPRATWHTVIVCLSS